MQLAFNKGFEMGERSGKPNRDAKLWELVERWLTRKSAHAKNEEDETNESCKVMHQAYIRAFNACAAELRALLESK